MTENELILVDDQDLEIGTMGKLEAHEKGLLHRAYSVFVLNAKDELLIQQRAMSKYHSAGLWTNTCCSHPKPNESFDFGVKTRLQEEMGFECNLQPLFSFIYKHDFENGLTEHELDHVFLGRFDGEVNPNPEEVMDYKWVNLTILKEDIEAKPETYTVWFKLILDRFIETAL